MFSRSVSVSWGKSAGESGSQFTFLPPRGSGLGSGVRVSVAVRNVKNTRFVERYKDERGSISILTIGLFILTVAFLILITDIASISVSKQSLVHASESAAMRASQNVDLGAYYRGNTGVTVPIDCGVAYQKAIEELRLWSESDSEIRRPELDQITLTEFSCSGNRVQLSTSARTTLPFRLPQSPSSIEIHTTVEAESDRVR